MVRKKDRKLFQEWHLYSATFVTGVLVFVSITVSPVATHQAIGTAFSTLVGSVLFMSKDWKSQPTLFHKWSMAIAVIITMVYSGVMMWFIRQKDLVKE